MAMSKLDEFLMIGFLACEEHSFYVVWTHNKNRAHRVFTEGFFHVL